MSDIVKLLEWRINEEVPGNKLQRPLHCRTGFRIAGEFLTDPKQWSNVAATLRRPPKTGYTKPFLHLACRFVVADGEQSKLHASRMLNHSRTDKGEVSFRESVHPPLEPGTYELQFAVGIEPAEGPNWGGLPSAWHVVARTIVEVVPGPLANPIKNGVWTTGD